jgi:hypothetical protein
MGTLSTSLRRITLCFSFLLFFALLNYAGWCVFEILGIHDTLLAHYDPFKFFPWAVGAWFALLSYWLWYMNQFRSPQDQAPSES